MADLYDSFAEGALRREDKQRENGYKSVHIIAKFGEKRANLPEYQIYKDLKCEIQLATILHHAWSEVEHELIYKDEKQIKEEDKRMFFGIQNRLYSIMANYLDKASGEIEGIYRKIAKNKKKNGE
jgi:ppGpp synthetase/RelA/SpoT-type nucleotidyltranferase